MNTIVPVAEREFPSLGRPRGIQGYAQYDPRADRREFEIIHLRQALHAAEDETACARFFSGKK